MVTFAMPLQYQPSHIFNGETMRGGPVRRSGSIRVVAANFFDMDNRLQEDDDFRAVGFVDIFGQLGVLTGWSVYPSSARPAMMLSQTRCLRRSRGRKRSAAGVQCNPLRTWAFQDMHFRYMVDLVEAQSFEPSRIRVSTVSTGMKLPLIANTALHRLHKSADRLAIHCSQLPVV